MATHDRDLLWKCGIVVTALTLAAGCRRLVHEQSSSSTSLELVVPVPPGTVIEAIRKTFAAQNRRPGRTGPDRQDPIDLLSLADESDPLFVDYGQMAMHTEGNEALAAFLGIPPAERGEVFHAFPGLDDYWFSEYRYGEERAPFRCSFVIRVWEASSEETGVSVVEFQPTVRLGKRFGLGHSGPGMYLDTRFVDATRRDRQIVLDAISEALASELRTAQGPSQPQLAPSMAEEGATVSGTGDLTLTGAMNREIRGANVLCGSVRIDGRNVGGSWGLYTDDLVLRIVAMTDEELSAPTVALQARPPARWAYVMNRGATVSAARDRTSARIDADFHEAGGSRVVQVKGTLKCPPK